MGAGYLGHRHISNRRSAPESEARIRGARRHLTKEAIEGPSDPSRDAAVG